jgi:hypothetical protein
MTFLHKRSILVSKSGNSLPTSHPIAYLAYIICLQQLSII